MKILIRKIIVPMVLIVSFGNVAFANEVNDKAKAKVNTTAKELNKSSTYTNFRGVVKKVVDMKYFKRLMVSSAEGEMIAYNVYGYTPIYKYNNLFTSVSEGDEIVVGYKKTTPQTATVPPQINPEVIVILDKKTYDVSIDFYDKNGLVSDGSMYVNVDKNTQIIDLNGSIITDPFNKTLVVLYNYPTLTYPAKITPKYIMAMSGKDAVLPHKIKMFEDYVKGLKGDDIYTKDDVKYVKLETIANKYGYKLEWNESNREIYITKGNVTYIFKQDENMYMYNKSKAYFTHAPIEYKQKTYVEMDFIGKIMK